MTSHTNLPQPNEQNAKAHILVVEDEYLVRMMLTDQLRENGYRVTEASNADEASLKIADSVPQLIVTDIRMPGTIDGLGLLKWVRERHLTLPIIVVSADLTFLGNIDGYTLFLSKPYSFEEVIHGVETLLNGVA